MITIIGTIVLGAVGFGVAHYSGVASGEFGALIFATVWLLLRLRRAMGISNELRYLTNKNQLRMREWSEYGDTNLNDTRIDIRNRLMREYDSAQSDRQALKKIQW